MFAVRARVLDRDELAVPDSFAVRISSEPRGALSPAETTLTAWDGEAWGYLRRARRTTTTAAARATIVARLVTASGTLAAPPARFPLASARGGTAPASRAIPSDSGARPAGRVAAARLIATGRIAAAESSGAVPRLALAGRTRTARGRRRLPRSRGRAQAGRVARSRGGGDDAAGAGPGGTRASALNLEVARALAAMLEAAGASVVMTRDGDHAVSELERVQVAEGFHAERYLRIGHANAPPLAGHYFSSGGGKKWGQRVALTFTSLGLDAPRVAESAKYPLAQVSAIALYVSSARVDSAENSLCCRAGCGPRRTRCPGALPRT